jgi:hypothetical protein
VLHLGSGVLAAVGAGALVNARVLLYGAALEPWFRGHRLWFRLLGPQFILDQTYLAAIGRMAYRADEFRRYWGWLGTLLLLVWTGSVVLGLLAGPLLPPLPHLALVGTALFVAMLVPELGIVGGTAAGVLAALVADRRLRHDDRTGDGRPRDGLLDLQGAADRDRAGRTPPGAGAGGAGSPGTRGARRPGCRRDRRRHPMAKAR